jgi:TonB-dependent starch-binding outer membrane protein SusC
MKKKHSWRYYADFPPLPLKLLRVMKLSIFLTCILSVNMMASVYSQKTRFDLDIKDQSLRDVLKTIENESLFRFFYNDEFTDLDKKLTFTSTDQSIDDLMSFLLDNTEVSYKVLDNNFIVITPKVLLQQGKVTGTVKDSKTGDPLPGVTIVVEGTTKGSITDVSGKYTIDAVDNNAVLVFSYVGYNIQKVLIAGKSVVDVGLEVNIQALEEVVVIGYGTVRKKDVTGSVGSVQVTDQVKTPVISAEQLLEGRVAGVQVIQQQSQPGAAFSVRIRGTNSINSSSDPLYVIDGYAGGGGDINPSDILSIDILKDASATAIYGSRGANGVVLITTKRGSTNATKINIDAYTGVQQVTKKFKMMDAKQFAVYSNTETQENNDLNGTSYPLPFTQEQINALGKGTDWQDEIQRIAPISNVSISFNGGTSDSRHYLSINLFDQNGVIISSDYKKASIRYNMDQTISPKIKVGISSQLGYSLQSAIPVSVDYGTGVMKNALDFNPGTPVKDSNGEYTLSNEPVGWVEPLGNPVAWANKVTDNTYVLNTFVNLYGEYDILKELKFRSTFGVNYNTSGREQFIPTDIYEYLNVGLAAQASDRRYNWLNENTLTYSKNFAGKHSINVTAGLTFQHWYSKGFGASITNLSTNLLGPYNFGVGTPGVPSAYFQENVLASYFGRINYELMGKYLFTFTMRADGSSRFGENDKWGYFPSGAFAWKMSEENFIKNIESISDMKLRMSYGVTGNQEIGSYNALSQYGYNEYALGVTPIRVVGISPANIANPNLKWESTASTDIGIDLGLWKNRLTLTTDYYYKNTSNLLLYVNIPMTTGYTSILQNIGSVSNKGFEFSATTLNIDKNKVKWSTTFNFSTNKNNVEDLGPNPQIYTGGLSGDVFHGNVPNTSILIKDSPIGSFYGYVFDGIWQTQEQINNSGTLQAVTPGDPIYKDMDGDKELTEDDRRIIGQASPKFIYGLISNLTVGKFNLSIFIHGVNGNKILNENLYRNENGLPATNKFAYVATDSWHGEGTSNTLPRVSSNLRNAMGFTSDVLQNGSFLRLKTITLSYDLPLSKKTSAFKSANIYVTAQNLLTFTDYTGYDPEVSSSLDPLNLGTDYNAYPNYKTFLFGVKFGF